MGNCSSCCEAQDSQDDGQIEFDKVYMPEDLLAQVETVVRDKTKKRSEMPDTWANRDGNDLVSLARDIKLELDERIGPVWMVIVGDFGYEGAHKEDHYVRFYYADKQFVVAKVI